VQSAGSPDELDDIGLEDIIGEKRNRNKAFFESIEDYFRDE